MTSSRTPEVRIACRFSESVSIFLVSCLIPLIILIFAPAAFTDDNDLLLTIPPVIAANAGWRNTTLSHPVPLTYSGYDEQLRHCRIVQVEDGYWIAYARYYYNYLFLMKTNLDGRTMIPPFLLATVSNVDSSEDPYRFALIPREEGGVQVVTTERDGGSTSKPAILHDYTLDRQGKIIRTESIMKERTSYAKQFKSLWAARTKDGRTVFAAISSGGVWYGVYTDSSDAQSWVAVPETGSIDYFDAHYDTALDRLYIMYSNYYVSSNSTYMTRWTLNGTRDQIHDLSGQVGGVYVYGLYAYHLMPTSSGLFVSLPNYVDPYRFFLMNPDGTIKTQAQVDGLVVNVNATSPAHMVTLDSSNLVRLVWRGSGTHPDMYYAVFSLKGNLLVGPVEINHAGSDIADHPNVFVHGRRTALFYSVDYAPDAGYRRLFVRHTAFDFPQNQPDLVVAFPHILQSPEYATLDAEIAFRIKVFNRGEAASTAGTLTALHNGTTLIKPLGALNPGACQELEFLNIPTPSYLTALPTASFDIGNGYWTGNNHIETPVRYPGRTPVYPSGSGLYTWTVRDKVSLVPLQYAQVSTTLPNIRTADGNITDVGILYESGSSGQITTRLPAGTYTFNVSRRGYPSESISKTVPGASSIYFELEPPGMVTLTFQDSQTSGPLHPAPNRVRVSLERSGGSSQYLGMGSEDGLVLNEVMPGNYSYSIKAFGYTDAIGSITVIGGQNNPFSLNLSPTPRGTLTGQTIPGSVDVDLEGTVIGTTSNSSGQFTLSDIPYGTYRIVCSKSNYAPVTGTVTVDSPAKNAGTFTLPAITQADDLLGRWTAAAWNRIDEVPGTFFNPNYKVTTSFGVFDFFGRMFYSTSGTAADFHSLYLELNGRKWYYYSVSTSFSLADIAFSKLDDIVDGAGDLASLIVDETDGGFFDFLEGNIGGGGSGGSTIVRVDSVRLYDGETDTVIFDSHDSWRQDYSFNGPMGYAIGEHTDNIQKTTIRIYLKVMNENFGIGPLYLMDKFRMEWRYENNNFELYEVIQNPPDYPSFTGP